MYKTILYHCWYMDILSKIILIQDYDGVAVAVHTHTIYTGSDNRRSMVFSLPPDSPDCVILLHISCDRVFQDRLYIKSIPKFLVTFRAYLFQIRFNFPIIFLMNTPKKAPILSSARLLLTYFYKFVYCLPKS